MEKGPTVKKLMALTFLLLALTLSSGCPGPRNDCSGTDDVTLANNVKAAMAKKFSAKVLPGIDASAKSRVITLTGKVNYEGSKKAAGETARAVKCVKDVVNNIEVAYDFGCGEGEKMCCCDLGGCECVPSRQHCPLCGLEKPY
jgi:osmotically-inducible protein OsmY